MKIIVITLYFNNEFKSKKEISKRKESLIELSNISHIIYSFASIPNKIIL